MRSKLFLFMIHIMNSIMKIPILILTRWQKNLSFIRDSIAKRCLMRFGENKFTFKDSFCSLSSYHEPFIWNYLKLREGNVFVDIGACIGKYTIIGARAVKNGGKVIAIEPEPKNYAILLKNVHLNGLRNVLALNTACWKDSQQIKLYVSQDSEGHSVKFRTGSYLLINARPLDDLLRELRLKKVDLVKIDAEGSELEILQSMRSTLINYKPRIIVEVFKRNLMWITKFLQRCNYIYEIIPNSAFLNPERGVHIYCTPQ